MPKAQHLMFAKPELPAFLQKLRNNEEKSRAIERPMKDAPAREDEMPAVQDASEEDLRLLRAAHGLPDTADKVSSSDETRRRVESKVRLGGTQAAGRKGRQIVSANEEQVSDTAAVDSKRSRSGAGMISNKRKKINLSFE